VLFALVSCSTDAQPPASSGTGLEPRPVAATDSSIASFEARPDARGLEVIAAAEDGRVVAGRRLRVPPNSSARLVYQAQLFDSSGRSISVESPLRLQDARFAPAPSRTAALLDDQDVLWLWDGVQATLSRFDEQVFPSFAFSHSGHELAYSKGQAPELEAWLADLATGERVRLTEHGAPVWGFAFAPDDQRVVFVDSREGHPGLVMVDRTGGNLAKLTHQRARRGASGRVGSIEPFPDGRRPPLWSGRRIWFENGSGVYAIDAQGQLLLRRLGASDLHRGRRPGSILFREGGLMWGVP
jgi:dipeptidyl aminopeptidase/acylaminoacyl peptidase